MHFDAAGEDFVGMTQPLCLQSREPSLAYHITMGLGTEQGLTVHHARRTPWLLTEHIPN